jgi:hypothetical protein
MPPLKNPRWEQFALLLAGPHPPSKLSAYETVGFKPNASHATRLSHHDEVAARIAELRDRAGKLLASRMARAEARAITDIAVSRESLLRDAAAALKLAEREANAQAMCQAIRLMAELAQISLKAPEDKPKAAQHVHLHGEALVDAPPRETIDQWVARKQRELSERSVKQLGLGSNRVRLVPNNDVPEALAIESED